MIQDRKGNPLQSLLMTLRKTGKHEESEEAQDPSRLESRRKIEQRIEIALGNLNESTPDNA
jgi:hypothetical protein